MVLPRAVAPECGRPRSRICATQDDHTRVGAAPGCCCSRRWRCSAERRRASAAGPKRLSAEHTRLDIRSTAGSGIFGRWFVDGFGLPAYGYRLDPDRDPRALQPDLKSTDAWHQLGNDHVVATAHTRGHVQLWSQDRSYQWVNLAQPALGQYAGGYGYLRTADGRVISTLYADRPAGARTRRDFATGYFGRSTAVPGVAVTEQVYAPFGDDPLLLHDVTIRNRSRRPLRASWIEYWGVNPRSVVNQRYIGLARPAYDRSRRTLTARQLPDAVDKRPLTVFAAALRGKVADWETDATRFFGAGGRARPAEVVAGRLSRTRAAPHAGGIAAAGGTPGHHLFALRSPTVVPPNGSITLRYAYGLAHAKRIPALVKRWRAAREPLARSERAWRAWLPRVRLGSGRDWLSRELQWDGYMLRSGATYEETCGHHIISQGGYYQYDAGIQAAYRDPLQHILPLIYADPELARETIRYSAAEQSSGLKFLPYALTEMCKPTDHGTSADLDLWLLLAAAEYGLGTRDLSFFDERLPWAGGGRASLWRHLRQAYRNQESRRGPHGGYLTGTNGDWSDFSTQFLGMNESILVTAQLAYVYPRLAELADARGDRAFAKQLRADAAELRAVLGREWTGRGWYSRGYGGQGQIGRGVIYGEPQPWALLAGVPSAEQAHTLVANVRRFLTGVGAPAQTHGPARIGSSQSPARNDPDVDERTVSERRHRRQQRRLRGRRLVRDQRLADLGARRARGRGAARARVRLRRVPAQHAHRPRARVPAALERRHLGRRRLLRPLRERPLPVRHRHLRRLEHADHAPAGLEPVRGAEAGRPRAGARRLPHRSTPAPAEVLAAAARRGHRVRARPRARLSAPARRPGAADDGLAAGGAATRPRGRLRGGPARGRPPQRRRPDVQPARPRRAQRGLGGGAPVRQAAHVVALAAALLAALLAPAAHAAGLRTVKLRSLEPRLQEVTLATKAVPGGQTRVRVLLPTGYRPDARRRYPVLYLLHGALEDESAYTDQDFGLREYTRQLPLIVVMPDSGTGGGYVNWWNFGRGGPPRWETYHVRQLIPWVDAHYNTLGTREGRAVAGLSMGGDGALKYAAKHPDLFVAAHSFSGAVDLNVLQQFLEQGPAYGPYATQEVRWRGNNAWDLADNLRGVELALRTGNGQRGGAYGNGIWPGDDPVEAGVHLASVSLHERLLGLGIPHVWDDYGPGAHSVPYWNRDLRLSLPLLMRTFRNPPARPRLVSLRAIEPRYSVYGWDVRLSAPRARVQPAQPRGTGRLPAHRQRQRDRAHAGLLRRPLAPARRRRRPPPAAARRPGRSPAHRAAARPRQPLPAVQPRGESEPQPLPPCHRHGEAGGMRRTKCVVDFWSP